MTILSQGLVTRPVTFARPDDYGCIPYEGAPLAGQGLHNGYSRPSNISRAGTHALVHSTNGFDSWVVRIDNPRNRRKIEIQWNDSPAMPIGYNHDLRWYHGMLAAHIHVAGKSVLIDPKTMHVVSTMDWGTPLAGEAHCTYAPGWIGALRADHRDLVIRDPFGQEHWVARGVYEFAFCPDGSMVAFSIADGEGRYSVHVRWTADIGNRHSWAPHDNIQAGHWAWGQDESEDWCLLYWTNTEPDFTADSDSLILFDPNASDYRVIATMTDFGPYGSPGLGTHIATGTVPGVALMSTFSAGDEYYADSLYLIPISFDNHDIVHFGKNGNLYTYTADKGGDFYAESAASLDHQGRAWFPSNNGGTTRLELQYWDISKAIRDMRIEMGLEQAIEKPGARDYTLRVYGDGRAPEVVE